MPEEHAQIFADASKIPFQVRPIDIRGDSTLHHQPVSIPRDLSGNLTLSSKHVMFPFGEFIQLVGKKNISTILQQKGEEDIILRTETVLQLARSPDAEETTVDPKKFWALPAFFGFLLGILLVVLGKGDPNLLFFGVAICAAVSGFSVGFLWRECWDNMLKTPFQKWAKDTFGL